MICSTLLHYKVILEYLDTFFLYHIHNIMNDLHNLFIFKFWIFYFFVLFLDFFPFTFAVHDYVYWSIKTIVDSCMFCLIIFFFYEKTQLMVVFVSFKNFFFLIFFLGELCFGPSWAKKLALSLYKLHNWWGGYNILRNQYTLQISNSDAFKLMGLYVVN